MSQAKSGLASRARSPRASNATQPGRPYVASAAMTSAAPRIGEWRSQPRRSGTLRVENRCSMTAAQAATAVLDAAIATSQTRVGPHAAGSSAANPSSTMPASAMTR